MYIQSAFEMNSEEKIAQEKNSLLHVKDAFKKMIIVKDDIKPRYDDDGILTIGVFDFLLDRVEL